MTSSKQVDESTIPFEILASKATWHHERGRQVVVIQGLGFVGVAVAAVVSGARDSSGQPLYFVIGVDLPNSVGQWKVQQINDGCSPIVSPDRELNRLINDAVHETGNLCATVSEKAYSLADVIVVDVPLDVRDRTVNLITEIELDLDGFKTSINAIGSQMKPDALVLVETTVPFGSCQQIVLPTLIEERAKRNITASPYLAHAYERVMPGPKYVDSIRKYWRTFAGINPESAMRARQFLSSIIDVDSFPLTELNNTDASELAKLLENSYRAANIAFIHEWALLAEQTGINLFEVVDSIRVRKGTHDNMRYPGFGVGGYCLTKDSLLAQWSAQHLFETSTTLSMTLDSLRINYQMPLHTLDLLKEGLGEDLVGKAIAVLGVSYLPEVPDTRNSPTELFLDILSQTGARVKIHDPYVKQWLEKPGVFVSQDLRETLEDADGIVLAVPHGTYRFLSAKEWLEYCSRAACIVDAQNVLSDEVADILHGFNHRLLGVGKGHWRKRGYQCQG